MTILTISDFLGRFHPLLVHLPIGILLLAVVFQWMLWWPRFISIKPAIPYMLFWGLLGAVASCISGYLLSISGDYDADIVSQHQWMGIYTSLSALVLLVLYRFHASETVVRVFGLLMMALLFITGHLGGTLTHGEGYITDGLCVTSTRGSVWGPMPDAQQVQVYDNLVKPLFEARCNSCHGSSKQKGKLRLDAPEFILKGGEDGKVIVAGRVDESSLLERLLLPADHEDHMPPKEKPQLSKTEIELLHWWIQSGASFDKKVADLPQDSQAKSLLASIASGQNLPAEQAAQQWPRDPISPADPLLVEKLKEAGVMIFPVAENSNYLQATFYTARQNVDSLLVLMEGLKMNLVALKLTDQPLQNSSLQLVASFENLRRLHLDHTPVGDEGIKELSRLKELLFLNLTDTKVSKAGLEKLGILQKLQAVYLYQTQLNADDFVQLKRWFPNTRIDTGGYRVPTFEADTTLLKY